MPNKNFPIVFESVKGECKQQKKSTSYYNEEEADAVIEWVKKLLLTKCNEVEVHEQDIGIISPYQRQCEVIREDLINNGYFGISVGSAEVFQGQERKVIIISTVRTESSDFINDPQVALNCANILFIKTFV